MSMNRREFAALFSGAVASLALPTAVRASEASILDRLMGRRSPTQETIFTWERVSDRVMAALGGGGNTMLVLGSDGSLQSDAKNFGWGRSLRREADAQGVPVRWFVNTHHHGDHSGGNAAFSDVDTFAHRNAGPRIRDTASANLGRAAEVLDRMAAQVEGGNLPAAMAEDLSDAREMLAAASADAMVPSTLHDGEVVADAAGVPVLMRWVSRGHTDGDTFVVVPEDNVIHGGDLLFHDSHCFIDVGAGATPEGWLRCLDGMLEHADSDTRVIPGHGSVGGREVIEKQQAYFHRLMEIVEGGMRDGMSRDEVTALTPDDLVALAWSDRFLATNLGIVYDEMAG